MHSPAFGQADLSNCERELIHLAGSVQPHGVILVLSEPALRILQASANAQALIGLPVTALLNQPVVEVASGLDQVVRPLLAATLQEPAAIQCELGDGGKGGKGGNTRPFEGWLHRVEPGVLVVELEPALPSAVETVDLSQAELLRHIGAAVDRFSGASTIGTLADAAVRAFRDLLGYDRVMVYKFDPDGHGKIIAEARDPRLESLLGHHYPASDIPQRARELYMRNRLRVLVDVHYEPSPLTPRRLPGRDDELDMSMSQLRSMSPLHLQYLKNMGVTATLVISLVREGQLWGLVACHHYAPRNVRMAVRTAADLLAEVISTRIAAIENYVHAQVAIQVRRLEQRLVEATSTEGDWRLALFRNPRTLLQPLDASGAALYYEGEVLTSGEVPSTPELRQLMAWIDEQQPDALFSTSSVGRDNPALESLTPTASGVVAVKLSVTRPDYLMWFRKEQLMSVTWAGDPSKPVVGNDPMDLSPRRSFAAWSEIVRGTALPWTTGELALARAFGASLIDIIVQVNAVRLLIAEHQLVEFRTSVGSSKEPVLVARADGRTLFANDAFVELLGQSPGEPLTLQTMADHFTQPQEVSRILTSLANDRRPWRGELALDRGDGQVLPVAVRVEVVPARDGSLLGYFLVLEDLSASRRAAAAREHLESSLTEEGAQAADVPDEGGAAARPTDELIGAILTNASLAAMDVADGSPAPAAAQVLEEIESSTRRAAALYRRIQRFAGKR